MSILIAALVAFAIEAGFLALLWRMTSVRSTFWPTAAFAGSCALLAVLMGGLAGALDLSGRYSALALVPTGILLLVVSMRWAIAAGHARHEATSEGE